MYFSVNTSYKNKMRDDIIKRVKEIVSEVLENSDDIANLKPEDSLLDYGITSINYIRIIVEIEQEYGIEFDDDDLSIETLKTLNDLVDYIIDRKENK